MKLRNEFVVAAPLDRAWETLLDIERVANFLPGAKIEGSDGEGAYAGSMRVKLGPMVIDYRGTARLGEVDESSHTAAMEVQAKDVKGQGGASAMIRNHLVDENGSTRVIAETELQITGRQAQFGRGIMQDVAGRMLGQFAGRFEAYLLESADAAPSGGEAPAPALSPAPGLPAEPAPLLAPRPPAAAAMPHQPPRGPTGGPSGGSTITWVAAGTAAALTVAAAAAAAHRRRRGFEFEFGFHL